VTPYVAEDFSSTEQAILRRYFTNLDGPVFALVNLPEVVKGALFARYSRSAKSLRRLFIDEFVNDLDVSGDANIDATIGLERAEALYDKVFFEYGDDSVAQLGGVHLACEQASNILTKALEWGRIMSYLEQSTRYIAYDARLGGRYRFFRDPSVLASPLGARYVGDMDRMFDTYAELVPRLTDFFREAHPKHPDDSDFVYRQAIRAKAFDALRGLLPAASLSNVGIYGSGQGYEALLLRLKSLQLPEANAYADLMLTELRKVIPSFLKRVDLPDRGGAWSNYLATNNQAMAEVAAKVFPTVGAPEDKSSVTLVDFDPDAEIKTVAAMLYPYCHEPEEQIEDRVREMTVDERITVMKAYVGDRTNRRHKPGRALERSFYRFDVLSDYGAFRDLQRHRMMTIEWQALTPYHGYIRHDSVDAAGARDMFDETMERSANLYRDLSTNFPQQASYAVSLAYRVRYSMQFNSREAMHLLELRSGPQGHPTYRTVAQQMHEQLSEVAGHRALAAMMIYVDHSEESDLERLDAERRAEAKRSAGAGAV
jgi:thymidylate synthase ThyX